MGEVGKRIWGAPGALLFLSGWALASPTLAAGPRLEIASRVHDFGEVRVGQEVRHVFGLRNAGDEPLVISRERASCACAAALSSHGVVPAGESGWIEVYLDSPRSPGSGARTVEFSTNDPQHPSFVLALQGRVVPDVSVDPERLFFGRVPPGVGRERSLVLETAPGVSIQRVRRGSGRLKMRYERLPAPRSGIRLYVELKPQTRLGPFDDELVVTTSGGRSDTHLVQVLGVIESPADVAPTD